MKAVICTICLMSFCCLVEGQVDFSQIDSDKLPTQFHGGVAMAIVDIDGDKHDDLVTTNDGKSLSVYCYRGSNSPYELVYSTTMTSSWSVVAGDVTNDGLTDILIANSNSIVLLKQVLNTNFERVDIYYPDWLPQGSNLVDVDTDGDLDYFICNDEGKNIILLNDGFGVFSESDIIDFTTEPVSDNSGNYSSIWTDIDGDHDLDLYIGKCRVGATTFDDPRRINTLYINNGDGSFTESAESFGLADAYQSWSVDSGDIDNDGDQDILVTNHDGPHHLYLNEGGVFSQYNYGEDIISFALQGVFHDMDNNGWQDIIITDGKYNYILYNDNMSFTRRVYQTAGAKPNTSILMDFNSDGFADIYGSYPGGGFIGSSSNISNDRTWLNNGNENKYINIKLDGSLLAGAKVKLNGTFGELTREVKLGSSYGQMSSSTVHFGLGSTPQINSLEIVWPDQSVQTVDVSELTIDRTNVISKQGCVNGVEKIQYLSSLLCEGDSIVLESEYGDSVTWLSSGMISNKIDINSQGNYNYRYVDDQGCEHISDYLNTKTESEFYSNILDMNPSEPVFLCDGEEYILEAVSADSYVWSTNDDSQNITISESGDYSVTIESACGNFIESDTVMIQFNEVENPMLTGDLINIGESGNIMSDVDSTYWYGDAWLSTLLGKGRSLMTDPLFESRYYYAVGSDKDYSSNGYVGLVQGPDTLAYSGNQINSGLAFEVYNQIKLKSVKVETDTLGPRQILITKDGELVYSEAFVVNPGISKLELGVTLAPGSYIITTDKEVNNTIFGHNGPRFTRVQDINTVSYPYVLGGDLSINNSLNGSSRYYYFFDWEVDYNYQECTSSMDSVFVEVRPLSVGDMEKDRLVIHPNPANEFVNLNISDGLISEVKLYSLIGELIKKHNVDDEKSFEIDLKGLASGTYILQVQNSYGLIINDKILIVK